ncbi:MAG TPA: glycosyltransferase [Acidimicrobiales bacterium]|nr:glycosyltransferase [Acidimicrobiales bacterium]
MQRLAMLSMHSSPLAQPGVGDSGGMNVYVRELSSALAQAGVDTTTYVRRWARDLPDEVAVEPGLRVVHIDAGDPELPKEHLFDVVGQFAAGVAAHLDSSGGADLIHANYWLSGVAGHRIKHQLDLPLVCTFHTLARVKAEGGDAESAWRELAEMEIIGCADAICVSCSEEERQFRRHYGDPPGRVEIVAPGVEHAFFAPGDRIGARQALGLGLGDEPLLLFVGRIQPLKGVDVAVRTLAALDRPEARLVIVGGASGVDGDAEVEKVAALVDELGLTERVHFVAPQPHHLLSSYYRAADVALVPSRSESFGLVALEAAACGTPVVASAVGGLLTLVDHGHSGFLVAGRDPEVFASYTEEILGNGRLAVEMAVAASTRSRGYTWSLAAARLRRVYADLTVGALVECQ